MRRSKHSCGVVASGEFRPAMSSTMLFLSARAEPIGHTICNCKRSPPPKRKTGKRRQCAPEGDDRRSGFRCGFQCGSFLTPRPQGMQRTRPSEFRAHVRLCQVRVAERHGERFMPEHLPYQFQVTGHTPLFTFSACARAFFCAFAGAGVAPCPSLCREGVSPLPGEARRIPQGRERR